jgi:glutamate carboxypeptidase
MDWEMLQDRMVHAIGDLVSIESPSSDVTACQVVAEHTNTLLEQWLGAPAHMTLPDGQPLLHWGHPEPRFLLLGHLDTVWPIGTLERMPWRVADGRMSGPGVFDMKAGVVVAIAAAQLLSDRSDIAIMLTTDEEVGSPNSRAAITAACAHAQAALVFEPAAGSAYKTRRKGTSWYEVEFLGRASHAGLEPEAGVNALLAASLFAIDAATWANPLAGTTVTPTTMRAGTTANTVPDRAVLTLDVRAWDLDEQERVDEGVRTWAAPMPDLTLRISGGIDRAALTAESSARLFDAAQQCAAALGYNELSGAAVGGASDGNLTAAAGVPTLDGMGATGSGAHADHEWASVADLVPRARIAAALIEQLR